MTGSKPVLDKLLRRLGRSNRLLTQRTKLTLDLATLVLAFGLAYLARFDFALDKQILERLAAHLPVVVLVQLAALSVCGVTAFIWRYIGLTDVRAFVKAAALSCAVLTAMRLLLPPNLGFLRVPLSVIVIDTALAFFGVLGVRLARRALWERVRADQRAGRQPRTAREPVLLIGAGHAGMLVLKEIASRGDFDVWVDGFVDDDPFKAGAVLLGRSVLGNCTDLPRITQERGVGRVIITMSHPSRREMRRIVEICESIPVRVQITPGLQEILGGQVEISRFRDVGIEDLLGREPVELDETVVRKMVTGRIVMVTGAGGSIGSELCRQLARFEPGSLMLVERAEFALFDIDCELRRTCPELVLLPLVADVGDETRMRAVISTYRPDVVFHAAAHKHVPLMETNPGESVKNNILATRVLGELAGEFGVDVFVMISTDKAVRPSSVMGASKRIAELVVQDLDARWPTRFLAVRFGNVMGSAGSVIPIFREQLQRGGPLTVTHPNMVRYFMTIPEACQLVLQAGAMGLGGEIFVLDMGEPVRILDLAEDMIRLHGLKPYEDVDVVFTGLRPGEKLFEELDLEAEHMVRTRHQKIFIGQIVGYPHGKVEAALEELRRLAEVDAQRELRSLFNELLPDAKIAAGESAPADAEWAVGGT